MAHTTGASSGPVMRQAMRISQRGCRDGGSVRLPGELQHAFAHGRGRRGRCGVQGRHARGTRACGQDFNFRSHFGRSADQGSKFQPIPLRNTRARRAGLSGPSPPRCRGTGHSDHSSTSPLGSRVAGVGTFPGWLGSAVAPASKGLIPQPVSMSRGSLGGVPRQRQGHVLGPNQARDAWRPVVRPRPATPAWA